MNRTIPSAVFVLSLLLIAPLAHPGTIGIPPNGGPILELSSNVTAVGQSFMPTPGDDILKSFSFDDIGGGTSYSMRTYVYAWTGASISGSALYTSDVTTVSALTSYAFTSDIAVIPGEQYVALFSAEGLGGEMFGYVGDANDSYAGGSQQISDSSPFATGTWISLGNAYDVNFTAHFVPEPSMCGLSAMGALCLAVWCRNSRWRRRAPV